MCTDQLTKTQNAKTLKHGVRKIVAYQKTEEIGLTWLPNQDDIAESPMN